ncbi:MAG: TIGR04211 family SH3 domain-containing protein, partial [Gammaproteobacteria bacterium]
MRRIFIVLLLAVSSAQAAHITDKLLVGLYAKPEGSTKPIKVLPSGTPLEILEQKGAYSRVRLGDGKDGWVKSVYISKEKPARAMLLELQAKLGTLQNKLQQTEKDLKAA